MNTKNLSTLNIHKLTKAQYDRELAAGRIDEDALYLVPDTDMTDSEILARLDDKADKATLASSTVNGLMAKEDKIKLNSISGYYGTCSTAKGTQAKVVTCENFVAPTVGTQIFIKFDNAQTYNGAPTLNINDTGAKPVKRIGTTDATRYQWQAGEIVGFIYDGTNYVMIEGGLATTTYYGATKLSSTLGTSESVAATPKMVNTVNTALNNHIASVGSAEDTSHVKLSDAIDNTELTAASGATAATPAAVAAVNENSKIYYIPLEDIGTNKGFQNVLNAYNNGRKVMCKLPMEDVGDILLPLVIATEDNILCYITAGTSAFGFVWSANGDIETIDFQLIDENTFIDLQTQLNNHIATTGDDENQGHLKLSDAIDLDSSVEGGIAATPKAVKDALKEAKETATKEASKATSDANRYTNGKITDLIGPVLAGNETLSGLETYISNNVNSLATSIDTKLANYVKNNTSGTIGGDLSVSGSIAVGDDSSFIGDLTGTADNAKIAEALNSKNIGNTNNPVYFDKDGKPAVASGIVTSLSNLSTKVNNQDALIAAKAEAKTLTDHIDDKTHITDAERTSWNSAEQNAKDHADDLDSAIRGGSTSTLKALEDKLAATDKKAQANAAAFANYTTTTDLAKNYATKSELSTTASTTLESANSYTDEAVANLVSGDTITKIQTDISELSAKVTKDIANLADNYTTTSNLNTTLDSYATKGYADQAEADAIKSANEYTDDKIALIMDNASTDTLDSIKELATAIKDNDGAIAALDAIAAERVAKAGDTMTGDLIFSNKDNVYAGIKWSSVNSLNPFIGYATDKTNGTFVLGAVEGTKAASGLSINGDTKALQWKGTTLATTTDLSDSIGDLSDSVSETYVTKETFNVHEALAGSSKNNGVLGHVKLSDAINSNLAAESDSTAATPKAVKAALEAAKSDASTKDTALQTALVGSATDDYNTLGKLETKIKAVDTKVNNTNNAFGGYYTKDELKNVITGVTSSNTAKKLLSFTHIDGHTTDLENVYASHTKAIAQDADMYLFGSIEPASYKQNRYNTNVKVSLSDNKLHAPNLNISNTASISTLAVSTKATVQGTLDVAGGLTTLGNGLKVNTANSETITFTDIATFKKGTTTSGASSMSSFKGDVMIGEGVTLHYNTTDKALEFVFA